MYPSSFGDSRYIWLMIVIYVFAKVAEALDAQIYDLAGVSGHTLKHVIAASGGIVLVWALRKRRRVEIAR